MGLRIQCSLQLRFGLSRLTDLEVTGWSLTGSRVGRKIAIKDIWGPHGENADVMCALGNISTFVFTFQNATT